jgi:hypothetical protein
MSLTLPAQIILAVEILFVLTGCLLLGRHVLSSAGRQIARQRAAAMPAWSISVPDFFLFLFCVFMGGVAAQLIASMIVSPSEVELALSIVVHGGAFHAGMLAGVILFRGVLKREPRSDRSSANRLPQGFATLLIALPLLATTGLIWQALMNGLGVELQEQDLIGIFAETKSPVLLGCMAFLAVVIAPITEELIFRGAARQSRQLRAADDAGHHLLPRLRAHRQHRRADHCARAFQPEHHRADPGRIGRVTHEPICAQTSRLGRLPG